MVAHWSQKFGVPLPPWQPQQQWPRGARAEPFTRSRSRFESRTACLWGPQTQRRGSAHGHGAGQASHLTDAPGVRPRCVRSVTLRPRSSVKSREKCCARSSVSSRGGPDRRAHQCDTRRCSADDHEPPVAAPVSNAATADTAGTAGDGPEDDGTYRAAVLQHSSAAYSAWTKRPGQSRPTALVPAVTGPTGRTSRGRRCALAEPNGAVTGGMVVAGSDAALPFGASDRTVELWFRTSK